MGAILPTAPVLTPTKSRNASSYTRSRAWATRLDLGLLVYDSYQAYNLIQAYTKSSDPPGTEPTPTTHSDIYKPVKGTPGKRNNITGEIWEKDKLHKNHFEVYKNKKDYENGRRDRSVWEDGRLKEKF